jgi:hypothetical protein
MADLPEVLKSMTVKALRELARKQLGAGYTKLKTKSQLVSALAKGLEGPVAKGLLAKLGGKAAPKAAVKTPVKAPVKAVAKAKATPTSKVAKPTAKATSTPSPTAKATAIETAKPRAKPAKPSPIVYDEHLGDLPDRYEDDSFIALPVDPSTLFLYWDFNPQTTAAAASGLPSARAVLSVHGDGEKVRELEFALESRSFYLRNLAPGRSYHAEIDFVGSDGRRQRLGRPTNAVGLPPSGPSPVVDDRFIAFPWEWKRGSAAGPFATRPSPGAAQRDLAATGWRGGSSQPMPWFPGGALSGQPMRK